MIQYEVRATNEHSEPILINYSDFTMARSKVIELRQRLGGPVRLFRRVLPQWEEVVIE